MSFMQTIRGYTYMVTRVGDQTMYLDPNTYGRLVRKYGTEQASKKIQKAFRDATDLGLKGRRRSMLVIRHLLQGDSEC